MGLPPVKGVHAVGTSYWRASVPRRTFGNAKLKDTQKPAFVLEEVAFQAGNLYYRKKAPYSRSVL
ncbi:hypothetical protein FRC17_001187 [Serendipita sp. 399]|nr:hypothetical protein FRC17_001187 [Serendipita sp. 399]